jgi:hypothetical protein
VAKPKSPIDGTSNGVHKTVDRSYHNEPDYTGAFVSVREGGSDDDLISWRAFALASLDTIERLLRIYMEVVYPILPLFHGPTLWERIRNRDHLSDRGFFASVMAACALASARARDGAVIDTHKLPKIGLEQQSEVFYSGAACAVVKDFNKAQGFGYLRACALLAVTAIQYGQIASMHQYLGHFCTLSAMQQFHDEAHWPRDMPMIEKEECRRLYWSMYSLDVLAAVVFNGVLKFQETSANVRYPTEVDDEFITPTSCSSGSETNWLRGWNTTTDLYRILEHTIKQVRSSQQGLQSDRAPVTHLLGNERFNSALVMEGIHRLYQNLPARFKDYSVPVTGNPSEDVYGFQAANIQATFQLARMTLSSIDSDKDVHQKCAVAENLLSAMHSICPRFLTVISTPLVYHLGGIGHILAGAIEGSLTESAYQRVRTSLVSLADLLENLETGLQPTAGASKGLRAQVAKIDAHMQAQRSSSSYASSVVNNSAQPQLQPPVMAVSAYAPAQRFTQQQQPPVGHAFDVLPAQAGAGGQFQVPQEVVGAWPWPFEAQNDPGHAINNVQGFGG